MRLLHVEGLFRKRRNSPRHDSESGRNRGPSASRALKLNFVAERRHGVEDQEKIRPEEEEVEPHGRRGGGRSHPNAADTAPQEGEEANEVEPHRKGGGRSHPNAADTAPQEGEEEGDLELRGRKGGG